MEAKTLRERLSSWDAKLDAKAPLTNKQKDAFMELTTHSGVRALPIELPLDDVPSVAPRVLSTGTSEEDAMAKAFASLTTGNEKIENAQQFFAWFSEVEDNMAEEEDAPHRRYIEQLQSYQAECDSVLDQVTQALQFLEDLKVNYVQVARKTNDLHEDCEHLLAEQNHLVNTAENINNKLSYFNELERISTKLGSPTLSVTSESFVPLLSRLDECIAYISKNPQYKESPVYMARFKQCLTRALNSIKTHVVHILETATQQVQPKKELTNATDQDAFTLFYGKFRTNAPRVKSLMEQIEQRLEKSPEYEQLLTDCHQCYFNQRKLLLVPSVTQAVGELATKHARDHCALMRSGCAFMVHVCEDEYQLYDQFFTKKTPQLDAMLEELCYTLYDVFRPLIIHVNHLETLSELCSILKVEMIEEHVQNNHDQLGAFETVCAQMLEDVQERLVYRTHIYIRSEILNYNPASGDLAYPEKLEMMESIAQSLKQTPNPKKHSRASSTASSTSAEVAHINGVGDNEGITSTQIPENKTIENGSAQGEPFVTVPLAENEPFIGSNMPMSPADLHGMWYPTVRRTLVCLSKLYRCIDKTTFQGLSQETLSMCIHSLVNACDGVTKRKSEVKTSEGVIDRKTQMDGQLFLIKHLLILREQIAPFQVDFSVKETGLDFSKIKDAAMGLLKARSKLLVLNSNNALLQFLLEGTPQVTETFVDSKKEVDVQLKKTCEEFIHFVTDQLVGPLRAFLSKAAVINQMQEQEGNPKVALRQQPFASPEKIHDTVSETYRNLKKRVTVVQQSMALYLANKDTEYILFKPIKVNVQQSFQQLHQFLSEGYNEEDLQIIGAPSLEQVNLLLSSSPTARSAAS